MVAHIVVSSTSSSHRQVPSERKRRIKSNPREVKQQRALGWIERLNLEVQEEEFRVCRTGTYPEYFINTSRYSTVGANVFAE